MNHYQLTTKLKSCKKYIRFYSFILSNFFCIQVRSDSGLGYPLFEVHGLKCSSVLLLKITALKALLYI